MKILLSIISLLFATTAFGQGVSVRSLNGNATNLNLRGQSVFQVHGGSANEVTVNELGVSSPPGLILNSTSDPFSVPILLTGTGIVASAFYDPVYGRLTNGSGGSATLPATFTNVVITRTGSSPFLQFVPIGTNAASGAPRWTFEQTVGNQSTNREVIYYHGFNHTNTTVVNTNHHAWTENWELNWDPSDPSGTRQLEHYRTFFDRTLPSTPFRYQGEVLKDGDIEQNFYARYLWFANPNRVNKPAITMTLSNADADDSNTHSEGTFSVYGTVQIFGSTNNGNGGRLILEKASDNNYAPYITVQNRDGTKSITIKGDANDLGLGDDAWISSSSKGLRLQAVQYVNVSTNLNVFGSVTASNVTLSSAGNLTAPGTVTLGNTSMNPSSYLNSDGSFGVLNGPNIYYDSSNGRWFSRSGGSMLFGIDTDDDDSSSVFIWKINSGAFDGGTTNMSLTQAGGLTVYGNGFSSDATTFTRMPTNTPTDGHVITAAGTAGYTKWAAGGSGNWTNGWPLTVDTVIGTNGSGAGATHEQDLSYVTNYDNQGLTAFEFRLDSTRAWIYMDINGNIHFNNPSGSTTTMDQNATVVGLLTVEDLYANDDVSALTFTDRSKAPLSKADAYEIVSSIRSKDGHVDHAALSPKAWGSRRRVVTNTVPTFVRGIRQTTRKVGTVVEPDQSKRDLGMVVSAQAMVIQDLMKRIEALEKK